MIPQIYAELRVLAAKKLAAEPAGQTLSATALVHEAYLALSRNDAEQWVNRGHFYVAAAQAMRRILIDRARKKLTRRRGGGVKPQSLEEGSIDAPAPEKADELIALDDALGKLEEQDPRKVRLVSLRFFVGLSIEEAAEILGISVATANRDWVYSRAWLQSELRQSL